MKTQPETCHLTLDIKAIYTTNANIIAIINKMSGVITEMYETHIEITDKSKI